jgi:cytochrome c-type biogenesis protein CcmH
VSGRARSIALIVGAVVVVGLAAFLASARAGGTESLADRAHEIAAGLRCPVCLNLSVADSPSGLAGEMRAEIASRLRAGQSPEQIRAFFVDRYGEWILLEPPRRGLNWVPWAVPVVALVAGVAIWATAIRRRRPSGEPRGADPDPQLMRAERERIDRELADLQEPG